MNRDIPIAGDGYFIGMMSGTSVDSIDAILCRFQPDLHCEQFHSIELPTELREQLFSLTTPNDNELDRVATLDQKVAELFADCANQLVKSSGISKDQIVAIGSHGQTVRHQPDRNNGRTAYTVQIGDPNVIVERTGILTVADFRRRDMAAGGEGAPLAPAFHADLLGTQDRTVAVVNIGGISNVTLIQPGKPVIGFDTGPGNVFMDIWINQNQGKRYDESGQWAASGECDPEFLQTLLSEPYFQLPAPKSTGREYFNQEWLSAKLNSHYGNQLPVSQNIQATLLELTAKTIIDSIPSETEEISICGGGAYNETLMRRVQELTGECVVQTTEAYGVPANHVEPVAFAWLAYMTLKGETGSLCEVTGASGNRILGGIFLP